MFKLALVAVLLVTVYAVDFEIKNLEIDDIWIGIQGYVGKDSLEGGGFVLAPYASRVVVAPEGWIGHIWARTRCDANANHCLTGDCGNKLQCGGNGGTPPASLAEITLKGAGGLDFYDISLVDGFNIPIALEPVNGQGDGSQYSCKRAACSHNFNDDCPDPLKLNTDSGVVGCMSACLAFNTDQYCCRNTSGTPDTCKTSDWPVDYASYFKGWCPDVYSYAYDDFKNSFTCKAEKYIITFGV